MLMEVAGTAKTRGSLAALEELAVLNRLRMAAGRSCDQQQTSVLQLEAAWAAVAVAT